MIIITKLIRLDLCAVVTILASEHHRHELHFCTPSAVPSAPHIFNKDIMKAYLIKLSIASISTIALSR